MNDYKYDKSINNHIKKIIYKVKKLAFRIGDFRRITCFSRKPC